MQEVLEEIHEETSIEIREGNGNIDPSVKKGPSFFENPDTRNKIITACVFLIIGLLSFFVIGGWATDPTTYIGLNDVLDEKKNNVMALTATATAASAAISMIPGGVGSSVADKLADFSTYFMIILAVIYLEKFLLTTFGLLTFQIMVPAGCVLFIIAVFLKKGNLARANMQQIGAKLMAIGIALVLVVPVSVWVTDGIDKSFEASLQASNETTQAAIQEIENEAQEADSDEESGNFLDGIVNTVRGGFESMANSAQDALSTIERQLNNMIDTIAVMIVTSCLIPLIVLFLFLQLAKVVSGIDFGGVRGVMNAAQVKRREFVSSLKRDN